MVHHRLDEALDVGPVANVGGEGEGAAAAVLDLLADILEELLAAPGHCDVGAGFGEAKGDAAADTTPTARHHCDLSFQAEQIEDAHAHAPAKRFREVYARPVRAAGRP